ncbi:MAG: hypothetical protein JW719_09875 [Pirellulales bacterium]|nr:hypothetical protein [Pirellulales bacterium]
MVRSFRTIEQNGELRRVQRDGCRRTSLDSLSEATDVFKQERLKGIVAKPSKPLAPIARDRDCTAPA